MNLSGQKLKSIPKELFREENAQTIKRLILSKNDIKVLPEEDMGKFVNLRELDISDNQIERRPPSLFKLKLQVLNISNNKITDMTDMKKLTELISLKAANNPIDIVYEQDIFGLTNLKVLDLSGIGIERYAKLYIVNELKELE